MTKYHLNETVSRSQPREAAIGELGTGVSIDTVVLALETAGIAAERLYFLVGPGGADVLRSTTGFFSVFDDVIDKPLSALDVGRTLVGVFGVDKDDSAAVRRSLASAGVIETHYFGKWSYS